MSKSLAEQEVFLAQKSKENEELITEISSKKQACSCVMLSTMCTCVSVWGGVGEWVVVGVLCVCAHVRVCVCAC